MTAAQATLQTNYPQIMDGFCYSGLFGVRPLNGLNWYCWNALDQMEDLRIAADSYRPRHWIIPKNFLEPGNTNSANIEPGKTVFYEFQVKEGSWLWGMQFCARITINEELDEDSNTKFSVIVRQGSDLPFADRPQVAAGVYSGNSADPFNTLKPVVNLLHRPRLIIPPAQLHVEISNDADPADDDFAVSCQLVLLFAEPK